MSTMEHILWNRDCIGLPVLVSCLRSRKYQVELPQKVIRLTEQLVSQTQGSHTKLYLIGKWDFREPHCPRLRIQRVENFRNPLSETYSLLGEFIISVEIVSGSQSDRSAWPYSDTVQHTISTHLTERLPSLDLNELMSHKITCHPIDSHIRDTPALRFDVKTLEIDFPLSFRPIPLLNLVSSALARSLETSIHFCDSPASFRQSAGFDVRFGYLSVTESNQFTVHLDSDPSVFSSKLVGIWVSGIDQVDDPRVWGVCLRFLRTSRLPCRQTSTPAGVSMLLVTYGNTTGKPTCYEVDCRGDQSDLKFSVYGAVEPSPACSTPESFIYEMNPLMLAAQIDNSIRTFNPSSVSLPRQPQPDEPSAQDKNHSVNDSFLREAEPKDVSQLRLSESHMLDASLLLEEGVAVSTSQILQTCSPNSVSAERPMTPDAIPRRLPVSPPKPISSPPTSSRPSPENKRKPQLSTVLEQDEQHSVYNPDRYQEARNSLLPVYSSGKNKIAQGRSNTIQSLLSSLPPSQLRRLDQIINSLLEQNKPVSNVASVESVKECKGVDAGVNTTQLFSLHTEASVHDPNILPSTGASKPNTSTNVVVSTSSKASPQRKRPTLADLRPLLRLSPRRNAKSTSALNTIHKAEEPNGRYVNLLSRIQHAIERRLELNSQPPRPISAQQSHNSTLTAPQPESVCDYPLDHRGHYLVRQPAEDRVFGWLQFKSQGSSDPSVENTMDDTIDSQLLRPTKHWQESLPTLSHINCTMANYEDDTLLRDLIDQTNTTTLPPATDNLPSISHSDATDQSAYLAQLVEKYLGLSTNKHAINRYPFRIQASSLNVTRYGGLNPSELSLATTDYLERHGLLASNDQVPLCSTPMRATETQALPNLLDGLYGPNRSTFDVDNFDCSTQSSEPVLKVAVESERILDMERLRSLPKLL